MDDLFAVNPPQPGPFGRPSDEALTSAAGDPRPDQNAAFYADRLSAAERLQIEAGLARTLESEIVMLRIFMRRVLGLSTGVEEPDQALRLLQALGLAATRLAGLLKTQRELTGSEAQSLEVFYRALNEVLEEMGVQRYE